MADSIMSKAATMEIPINSNGDTGTPEDDSLEQVGHSTITHTLTDVSLLSRVDIFELSWRCCCALYDGLDSGWLGQVLSNHAQACSYLQ